MKLTPLEIDNKVARWLLSRSVISSIGRVATVVDKDDSENWNAAGRTRAHIYRNVERNVSKNMSQKKKEARLYLRRYRATRSAAESPRSSRSARGTSNLPRGNNTRGPTTCY
jgi:hypothetical protein